MRRRFGSIASLAFGLTCLLLTAPAMAHSVSEQAQQRMLIGGFSDAAWIGAEHMLTGYDHLLFLLGVMLFLTRFSQIVVFITAFTAGHTITLLFATLAGVTANPYLVDAVIALTVTSDSWVAAVARLNSAVAACPAATDTETLACV